MVPLEPQTRSREAPFQGRTSRYSCLLSPKVRGEKGGRHTCIPLESGALGVACSLGCKPSLVPNWRSGFSSDALMAQDTGRNNSHTASHFTWMKCMLQVHDFPTWVQTLVGSNGLQLLALIRASIASTAFHWTPHRSLKWEHHSSGSGTYGIGPAVRFGGELVVASDSIGWSKTVGPNLLSFMNLPERSPSRM